MNPQDAIDFSREALKTCMMVGGPILVASLLIGLLVGVIQAMTQVQDQTVSFVPKILILILMIGLCLPWLTSQMLDFAKLSFEKPMTQWAGTSHKSLFPKQKRDSSLAENQSVAEELPTNRVALLPRNPGVPEMIKVNAPVHFPRSSSSAAGHDDVPHVEIPNAIGNELTVPLKSPFILPHYRTLKTPKPEIGG